MMKNLNKKKDLILLVKESYKMYRKKDIEVEEAEEEEEIIKEAEGGRMKMKSQGISQEIIMIYKKNRLINLHGNINTKIL
jgi:hypothetical protein